MANPSDNRKWPRIWLPAVIPSGFLRDFPIEVGGARATLLADRATTAQRPAPAKKGSRLKGKYAMSELHKPEVIAGPGVANAQTLQYAGREDYNCVPYPVLPHLPFAGRGVGGIWSGAKAEILREPSENVGYPVWEVAAHGRQAARDDELRRETLATIGQFACGTAHDVGNLLVAIVFGLSRLRGRQQAGELEETVEHALQAAEQGLAATRRLLQLARHRPQRHEIFDLNACIQEILWPAARGGWA